jgi:hypothetical protein
MELDESAAPYRGFLRSGSYPALSKRIVNSGGLLVRAAGWFALIVTAASAGYSITQRFVSQSAIVVRSQRVTPVTANPAQAKPLAEPRPFLQPDEQRADALVREHKAESSPQRAAALTLPVKRKQIATGAITQPASAAAPSADVETSPRGPQDSAPTAEHGHARDREAETDLTVKPPVTESVAQTQPPTAATSGDDAASVSYQSAPAVAPKPAPVLVRAPLAPPPPAAQAKPASLPLIATARIDGLAVNGSLTSANVRHGLDRVRPTLSECYAGAARRAGENRFSNVRVVVQFDERGRVKAQPSIEGAQLPGLEACLTSAFSKLVCRAPDTGTGKASMTVRFGPLVLAATQQR